MKMTDPDPDLSLSSVNYYISLDRSCPDLPVPGDSSASLAIDVDKDGTADFEIHAFHQLSASHDCGYQCTCFDYSVSISNLHAGAEISSAKNFNQVIAVSYPGQREISKKGSWSNHAAILHENFQNRYLGLKVNEHYGWMKIKADKSFNTVTIFKSGISGVKNKIIKAAEGE